MRKDESMYRNLLITRNQNHIFHFLNVLIVWTNYFHHCTFFFRCQLTSGTILFFWMKMRFFFPFLTLWSILSLPIILLIHLSRLFYLYWIARFLQYSDRKKSSSCQIILPILLFSISTVADHYHLFTFFNFVISFFLMPISVVSNKLLWHVFLISSIFQNVCFCSFVCEDVSSS